MEKPKTDNTPNVLAIGGLAVFAYLVVVLTLFPIPVANKELLFTVVGIVGGVLIGGPFGFYFGTTKSSEAKNQAIADQASAARTLAETAGGAGGGTLEGAVTIDAGAKE